MNAPYLKKKQTSIAWRTFHFAL